MLNLTVDFNANKYDKQEGIYKKSVADFFQQRFLLQLKLKLLTD